MKHLVERCVKLLIFARDTSPDTFVDAFHTSKVSSIRVNFIVTLDRKGEKFSCFFRDLFALIAKGETLLMAWAELAPQAQGPWMDNLPETILVPKRGDLKFIP